MRMRSLITLLGVAALAAVASPAAAYTIVEFPLPVANSGVQGIAAGPDGNLWFTETLGSRVGRITPSGEITDWSTGSGISTGAAPSGITAGPDGNLWFTEFSAHRIARITTTTAVATELPALPGSPNPAEIVTGPDVNLWFTEYGDNAIGRITPAGVVKKFSTGITAGAGPLGITAGPDGNLWFTERNGHRIGRITPQGVVTEFAAGISANSAPFSIAAGADGNLWFTEYQGNRIGRITPAGVVTEFASGLTAASSPVGIMSGPDGNVWFAEADGQKLGRITPAGVITEFGTGITPGSRPEFLALGSDLNIWFTETNGNRIGRLSLSPEAATGDATALAGVGVRLAGSVRPYARASVVFEYGTTTAYGSATPATLVGPSSASIATAASVAGLTPRTTYHYRIVASGPGGTVRGDDRTVTTGDDTGPSPATGGAPTGGAPVAGTDTTAPRMRVVGRRLDLARGRVRVLVRCPLTETLGCRGTVRIESVARIAGPAAARRPLRLGSARVTAGGGQTRPVTIVLTPRARRLVLDTGALPARVVVVGADVAGNTATTRTLVRLRARA